MNLLAQSPLVWGTFLLVVCRVGTILMISPLFGSRSVPNTVKVAFALLLSLVMLPMVTPGVRAMPETMPDFLFLVAREILIGAMIGFTIVIIFTALQAAGHLVGLQMGFSLANVVNPLTAEHASLIDQFYSLLAALIFFTVNGHHALVAGMVDSFSAMPIGQAGVTLPATLPPIEALAGLGREIYAMAVRMALPVMAALLLADVALAMIGRSVPQFNVFVVGMPAKIAVGFIIVGVTVPVVAMLMSRAFVGLDGAMLQLLRGL